MHLAQLPRSENKITKDNSWHINFIDALPEIIKSEAMGPQFNFQKASCGLDAGVKIYSKRVDSTFETMFTSMQGIKGIQGVQRGEGSGEGSSNVEAHGTAVLHRTPLSVLAWAGK